MQVLEGIKVLDFSKWLPGQYCGMTLGDFGADIIKLESTDGDATRGFTPSMQEKMSYWHLMLNRNKRGLTVNIKTTAGREVLLRLLKEADVFLEGFRPGYLQTLGLDYDTIKKVNPRLIYCSITGFGQSGPHRHMPAHDLNVLGLSGLAAHEDGKSISVPEMQMTAISAAMNAVNGILLALFAREKSGVGQYLDISLYAAAMSCQATGISSLIGCRATGSKPFGRTSSHYYTTYQTKDGRYMCVGTLEPKFWAQLCQLLARPELVDRQYDFEHSGEIKQAVATAFAEKTQQEWLELIGDAEFCVTPVCTLSEALGSDLTTVQTEMLETRVEDIGSVQYVRSPIKLSATPAKISKRAPYLGEDNEVVLKKLGYLQEEIDDLRNRGDI